MVETNIEKYLRQKRGAPEATGHMAKNVSQYRRESLEEEVARGEFREKGNTGYSSPYNMYEKSAAGNVTYTSFKKTANIGGGGTGGGVGSVGGTGGFRGSNDSFRQTPEIYSPLWLTSNLNLPRDRATINSWSRAYMALNPLVQNAITLHSTYPISKLNITSKNEKVQQFFEDMIEEIGLMNICTQIAQEYWVLGEAFPYAELDESTGKWSRIILQNPDYMVVKHSVVAGEPILSLRPDENLKRIVTSNRPVDISQRQRLHPSIIEHVKRGENIPLSNFYAHHICRKLNPYEVRGTGLIVSCFRNLMLYDKIRESKFAQADNMINPLTLIKIGGATDGHKPSPADLEAYREVFEACHDEETEVLTDRGFMKFDEAIEISNILEDSADGVSKFFSKPKSGIKIACFNLDTDQIEYHEPSESHVYNYDGDMYHFKNSKVDIKVTPNHRMWVKNTNKKDSDWEFVKAKDTPCGAKFRSQFSWEGEEAPEYIEVCGKKINIDIYLEFLGYLISEGCLFKNNKSRRTIELSQSTTLKDGSVNPNYVRMKACMDKFSSCLEQSTSVSIKPADNNHRELWVEIISGKDLYDHFANAISNGKSTLSYDKVIPSWVKNLKKEKLQILLDALVLGDGSCFERQSGEMAWAYYSSSKELIDDVYEVVLKCGYSPISYKYDKWTYQHQDGTIRNRVPSYRVIWSETNIGCFPTIRKTSTCPHNNTKKSHINKVLYKGKVWCFTVPTGLFITRRNGRVTVQGNSQYDKDFKIFTHDAVTVERVGASGAILDTSADMERLTKELYIGLMIPQVLMDGGGDVTYANGGITLDVLKQRYFQFRNMIASWLRTKVFAPICKINEFYDYKDGKKILLVPEVQWNHMSLFDAGDYVSSLMTMRTSNQENPEVSKQTIYRSLGLDMDDELRKLKQEAIRDTILKKEKAALETYTLDQLRTLGPDDAIKVQENEETVPGEVSESEADAGPGEDLDLGGGMPGMPGMP